MTSPRLTDCSYVNALSNITSSPCPPQQNLRMSSQPAYYTGEQTDWHQLTAEEGGDGLSPDGFKSNMNSQTSKTEPDPDAIKMFVGQIPRSMDENDLRKMFEEFGPIFQLNVLRDKVTGQSKGCCFVTFYTRKAALEAQNALHNIKTMPGMQHPIQMKPADSEKRNVEERKLFIGMLSKKCSENEVRMMFAPFGTIEECTVLREQNGQSKGCAFVTYGSRQCAQAAIKAMHHSQTMEGCRCPLVVKFADTQKEKEMKKLQQMNANLLGLGNIGGVGAIGPQYLSLLQQAAATGNSGGALANIGNLASLSNSGSGELASLQNLQNLQSLAALANMANTTPAALNALGLLANASSPTSVTAAMPGMTSTGSLGVTNTSNSTPTGMGGLGAALQSSLPSMATAAIAPSMNNGINGLGGTTAMAGSQTSMDTLNQAYSGIQQYAASFPNAFTTQTSAQLQQAAANSPAGKQTEGPDGANLFIYHLPQEFGDQDLMQMFMPFGSVVSAKVFIDKQTNLSKCFGFVSYDNPVSAQAAIQAMNGFQIGMKRLKVQLKRPKSDAKPY